MTDVTPIPKRQLVLTTGGGWPLRRTGPPNAESPRRRAEREQRSDCRSLVLARDRGCVFHRITWRHGLAARCQGAMRPGGWSTGPEVHEVVTRARGGDPLDPDNAVTLCPWANNEMDERQAGAEIFGLLLPSWATVDDESYARARRRVLAVSAHTSWGLTELPPWRRDQHGCDWQDQAIRDLRAWGFPW